MERLKRILKIGIPPDMGPEEAKYIGMVNAGALFFSLFTIPFMIYCYAEGWHFIVGEMLVFCSLLLVTFRLNQMGKHLCALLWFGTMLNWHLIIMSVVLGWDVIVHYLIFFTAVGAIMLVRRNATRLMIVLTAGCLACYLIALGLSRMYAPMYQLDAATTTRLNTIFEITIVILIIANTLIGRLGANIAEDLLKKEKEKSEFLLKKIQRIDAQKTLFYQNLSHEFRTPLTLIIGPLESLIKKHSQAVEHHIRRQLKVMLWNANRLLRLINQLLDLSKLDAGKMVLNATQGNLYKLVMNVVDSFDGYSKSAGVEITLDASASDFQFCFDDVLMEKVLFNLLSNALKFTPKDGKIHIRLWEGPDKKTVKLFVTDTGIGIPEIDLPFIFDRFQQVDGTMTRERDGTGIGLSLVKELVELHGGSITVSSEIGSGSKFVVTLPKNVSPPSVVGKRPEMEETDLTLLYPTIESDAKRATGAKGAAIKTNVPTILIVEDDTDMRGFIKEGLIQDYRVVEAVDGKDGLEKARSILPDLIISDVMMPKMDGYQLTREIKNSGELSHIPMILLTAKASDENVVEGLTAGAYDYIIKPFSQDVLLARVKGIVHRTTEQATLIGTDHLTGLRNREGWKHEVDRELGKIDRSGGVAALVFLDLDNFKKINDTYGHTMGDLALQSISSSMGRQLRSTDLAGRYGGEEFVIYFPETKAQAAAACVKRIGVDFRDTPVGSKDLSCTFSAGIVEIDTGDTPLDTWVYRADAAMYQAKKMGKKRTVIWDDTMNGNPRSA
jgi:diguanylate cyclase (GGDEF)-like protein